VYKAHPARRGRRARTERGASAVEFALLSPILFLLIFGIVGYGLWFNDSLNVRQGVREGARQAVVDNFTYAGCTTGSDMQKVACNTKAQIGGLTGSTYVKVIVPAGGWVQGQPLTVCAMVKSNATAGLVPLPSDGLIKSKTLMSIETVNAGQSETTYADAAPSGGDWSWCG
jgi:Flp pilus assembly protein TadG